MRLLMTFFLNLVIRRWRILLMIIIFITLPLLLIQYAMLKEQSLDSSPNWLIFDERNILNGQEDFNKNSNNPQNTIVDRLKRPADYCNLPLAKFYEDEKALGKEWKLKNVFMFVRHGQRSSADSMLNSNYEYHINCSLKQFPLFNKHGWKKFLDEVNKSSSHFSHFEVHGRCKENQMTLFGILQMFIMGSRLKKAYDKFLGSNLVSIFSTSYQRSFLSGEIIQHLLIKDASSSQHSKINESPSLIFCRPSENVSCQCPSLRFSYAKYNRHINYLTASNEKCIQLVNLFNSILVQNVSEDNGQMLSLSSLFDVVSAALCASNLEEISKANTFCWPSKHETIGQEPWGYMYKYVDIDGTDAVKLNRSKHRNVKTSHRCFSLPLINSLWKCYDERTEIINKNSDFRKYAKLASYPILREVITKVYTDDSKRSNHSEQSPKFVLYVGHDHSIRLLLGSLNYKNVMDEAVKKVLNLWPGFASRIVIEVFENVDKNLSGIPRKKFRLLYNGLDITSALSFCPPGNNGCDLLLFDTFISGTGFWESDLFTSTSYSQECLRV